MTMSKCGRYAQTTDMNPQPSAKWLKKWHAEHLDCGGLPLTGEDYDRLVLEASAAWDKGATYRAAAAMTADLTRLVGDLLVAHEVITHGEVNLDAAKSALGAMATLL